MTTRLLLTVACLAAFFLGTAHGLAQGRFIFQNNGATAITNSQTGARLTAGKVQMFYSTNLSALTNSLLPMSANPIALTNINAATPGQFFGGTVPVPGVPGGRTIVVDVRAWTGNSTNWDAAFFNWRCQYDVQIGQSSRFTLGLAAEGSPAPNLVNNGFTSFIVSPHLSAPVCPPFTMTPVGSAPFRFRIDAPNAAARGSSHWILIYASDSLPAPYAPYDQPPHKSNLVQCLQIPGANFPYIWTDPQPARPQRFYRIYGSFLGCPP